MDPKPKNLPLGISTYIQDNFREDYLTDIESVKNSNGNEVFYVDVTHDDNVYHLKFNDRGELIHKEIETIRYPDDEVELGDGD